MLVSRNLSEDCLYLNVFRPSNISAVAKLPVMLFIYGGSWVSGGTDYFVYDANYLALNGNVIVVTPNYRLGPFGFLGSTDLAASDPMGSTGNYGTT